MGIKSQSKKTTLAKKGRQTKWAPFWAVLKKFGVGKRIHPSQMTKHRRNWRRTKIKAGPRKIKRYHYG